MAEKEKKPFGGLKLAAQKGLASIDVEALKEKVSEATGVLKEKVVEVKEHPLYSHYVVIEHDNDLKTYYYGLSEVMVSVGTEVDQNTVIGVSGTTEIDAEAGNHVYLKVEKAGKKLNPEKLVGKKISEI